MKTVFLNLADPNILQVFGGSEYWQEVNFEQGTVILKENDLSEDFYYILSGNVRVVKALINENSINKELATIGAGDFFGEGALFSDKGRSATVTALSSVKALKLSAANFEKLITADSQAATGILLGIVKVLNSRLYAMNQRLVALYDVSRLIRKYSGNLDLLIPAIFEELSNTIGHFSIVLFGMDGLPKYKNKNIEEADLQKFLLEIPNYANKFLEAGSADSYLDAEGKAFVAIKKTDAQIVAILAAELCDDFKEDEMRLLNSIAEQIGNVI